MPDPRSDCSIMCKCIQEYLEAKYSNAFVTSNDAEDVSSLETQVQVEDERSEVTEAVEDTGCVEVEAVVEVEDETPKPESSAPTESYATIGLDYKDEYEGEYCFNCGS